MKKILISLFTVLAVVGAVAYSASAYFSDTEVSEDNIITTGTIDIAVDDTNPWTRETPYALEDMKPSYVKEIEFEVENVGENPLVLWKRVADFVETSGDVVEPECSDQGGNWTSPSGPCDWAGGPDNNDLSSVINYQMTVDGTDLIAESYDLTMTDLEDLWVPLGRLDPQESINVVQTYTMDEEAGNEYQGDDLSFDIELYAEQLDAPGPEHTTNGVVLENKDTTDWTTVIDGTWGLLTWDGSGNYRIRAWGLGGTSYRLRAWDYTTDTAIAYFGPTYGGGSIDDNTGTYVGLTTNVAAKYWLENQPAGSDNTLTLWESNLVTP